MASSELEEFLNSGTVGDMTTICQLCSEERLVICTARGLFTVDNSEGCLSPRGTLASDCVTQEVEEANSKIRRQRANT